MTFKRRAKYKYGFCGDKCANVVARARRRKDRRKRQFAKKHLRHVPYKDVDIFERDRWRCMWCCQLVNRDAVVPSQDAPTIDHIVPISKGGHDAPHNVVLSCFSCNCKKGNRFRLMRWVR